MWGVNAIDSSDVLKKPRFKKIKGKLIFFSNIQNFEFLGRKFAQLKNLVLWKNIER